jgi:hypothetical protein
MSYRAMRQLTATRGAMMSLDEIITFLLEAIDRILIETPND